jgi:hypothetical protein
MARPYASEITRLAEAFAWAATADLKPRRQAVRTAELSPLRAVGSGGSLTAAHALAGLHQRWEAATAPLWARPATIMLHGPSTRVGAVDLESKFTEAAIGNLPRSSQ